MRAATITVDLQRLLPASADAVRVESVGDYLAACVRLRAALHGEAPAGVDVRVYDATAAAWLADVARLYGDARLAVRRYTAREALAERWGVSPPASVVDGEILQSGLLDAEVTPRPGQTFEDALLEYYYGAAFAFPRLPWGHLATLLNEFDAERWAANARRALVLRTYRARLGQWAQREPDEARRGLVGRLAEDPAAVRTELASFKLLRRYPPALREKVLGPQASELARAGLELDGLSLAGLDLAGVQTELSYCLEEVRGRIKTTEDLAALVEMVSGELLREFEVVEGIVRGQPEFLTAALERQIERRFAPLRDRVGSRLAELRWLVAPAVPPVPDPSWDAVAWLQWVREAYMPYYCWVEASGKEEGRLREYACAFADWYYAHYLELRNAAADQFAYAALYGDRDRFVHGDAVGLVILLDNFNYVHFDALRELFSQQEVSLMEERPTFALVPTATEIGKPSVVACRVDAPEAVAVDYERLARDTWGPMLSGRGKSVDYLANLGELQHLGEREHDLYFLNYLPVDHVLHEDVRQTGQPPGPRIHQDLAQLVWSVVEFARRFGIEKRLVVYVTSDHGSTRIGREVVNILDKEFFKRIVLDKHHRYVAVSDERLQGRPQVIDAQCYIVERARFGTRQNYLVARGYYRFLETSEDFAVHGGLTPEEVVVPFARFELKPVVVEPPTVRLIPQQFRYAVRSSVQFEVGNPNSYRLENVTVALSGVDSEESEIAVLAPRQQVTVQIPAVFKREPGGSHTRELVARVGYECQGRAFGPVETTFTITLRTMMEVQDDFDL